MARVMTAQTPRVRMEDYRKFFFPKDNLSVNQKINLRSNILNFAKPISETLILNY